MAFDSCGLWPSPHHAELLAPAIWGGEQDQPEWQSEAELERFIDLVMRHSNDIATTLTYAAEDYFPVAPEFERHGEWVL